MNTDRELLELAAKAADLEYGGWLDDPRKCGLLAHTGTPVWNPLTDDYDALRLAVRLGIDLCLDNGDDVMAGRGGAITSFGDAAIELVGTDKYAATRRAIVRAAAEIGRTV